MYVSPALVMIANHYLGEKGLRPRFRIGSQLVSQHMKGAYTGETSPAWLEPSVLDVLVGHSEVRKSYEELSCDPAKLEAKFYAQAQSAINHGMRVVYCVGETLDEKTAGKTDAVLERQVIWGLSQLLLPAEPHLQHREPLIVAYEPRWSIGTGKIPTPEEIKYAVDFIRGIIKNTSTLDFTGLKIIYGESMDEKNAASIMAVDGVNGGLIGGASLDAQRFAKVVKYK